jgi:hypothetical protein
LFDHSGLWTFLERGHWFWSNVGFFLLLGRRWNGLLFWRWGRNEVIVVLWEWGRRWWWQSQVVFVKAPYRLARTLGSMSGRRRWRGKSGNVFVML